MPWQLPADKDKRFWISNDVLCMKWSYFVPFVAKAYCTKIVRTSWEKQYGQIKEYGFRFFSPRKSNAIINDNDGGLCFNSSVPSAIDLAILMNCNPICLLGVDQQMIKGNSHFWQFWPKNKQPIRADRGTLFKPDLKQQIDVFDQNKKVFCALKKHAEIKHISIYNCSSRTKLDVFEKLTLDNAVKI